MTRSLITKTLHVPAGAHLFVDPRDFGAKMDGVTDDTAAWQAAIDSTVQPMTSRGAEPLTTDSKDDPELVFAGEDVVLVGDLFLEGTVTDDDPEEKP